MSETPGVTMDQIRSVLAELAHRVAVDPSPVLDPVARGGIQRVVAELERFIPGLDLQPDPDAARQLTSSAAAALFQGRARVALSRALRGLTYAPHHAELHYLAASACFEMAAASEAVTLLAHTVWINPGHEKARRELEALSTLGDDARWQDPENGSEGFDRTA